MGDMTQLAAIAMTATLCCVVLKKQVAELSMVLALVAGGLILFLSMEALGQCLAFLSALADTAGLSPAVLTPVIKSVGIALLTRMTAELCRDAGESGIAVVVDMAGVVAALVVALPLMQSVLAMILSLQG